MPGRVVELSFKRLDKVFPFEVNLRHKKGCSCDLDLAGQRTLVFQPLDSLWLFWPDMLQVYLYPAGFAVDYQVLVLLSAREALLGENTFYYLLDSSRLDGCDLQRGGKNGVSARR